ncbi:ABC transporter substrate-binding protein [Goodfellowiella coeruleoviolacea]|uniref:Iron complex transport system substrate-binding protein n=1 Tax=Goodfellowiella coeruleoviolacea TaxID=334858 RepID=A0AAE3GHB4_9PSEU|nr:ABC transporter substrate-binding protein [Goodfellowiella coeruleoviolacea]MCP2167367.1 iron complex transport system substrate-binding protein [Goodfellowiella coeruleoviolacea]
MTRRFPVIPVLLAGCLLAGCGAEVAPRSAREPAPVTIENCGERITYPPPTQAVAYDMSSTEKMFALGLADRMRGIVMPRTAAPAVERSPYLADYRSVETLSTDVLSFETVVAAKADWVLAGWNSGFSEARGITPKKLDSVGIRSYQHTESCFNYGDHPVRVPPLEALYTDLRQLGEIFHVTDRADRLVNGLRERVSTLERNRPGGQPARVFLYDSGTDQPFTSGAQAAPNAIISLAGGRNVVENVDARWTAVGWESVVQAQPEVIVVVDYGDQPVQDKIAFLKSFPPLAATPAVRDDRFHVLDYGEAVSGPRNIDAAEKLAAYLRSLGR